MPGMEVKVALSVDDNCNCGSSTSHRITGLSSSYYVNSCWPIWISSIFTQAEFWRGKKSHLHKPVQQALKKFSRHLSNSVPNWTDSTIGSCLITRAKHSKFNSQNTVTAKLGVSLGTTCTKRLLLFYVEVESTIQTLEKEGWRDGQRDNDEIGNLLNWLSELTYWVSTLFKLVCNTVTFCVGIHGLDHVSQFWQRRDGVISTDDSSCGILPTLVTILFMSVPWHLEAKLGRGGHW